MSDSQRTPRRIQRHRTKGWRLPPRAVYVGRSSLFGNPWRLGDAAAYGVPPIARRQWCISKYREEMKHLGLLSDYAVVSERRYDEVAALGLETMADYARHLLRGKDLVCWCPLDKPCHADVLLEAANG